MNDAGPVPPRGSGPRFFRRRAFMISPASLLLIAIGAIWAVTALQKFVTFPRAHPLRAAAGAREPPPVAKRSGSMLTAPASRRGFCRRARPLRAPLLIHAHGNGELIDIQAQSVAALRDAGIGVLLVEYPGLRALCRQPVGRECHGDVACRLRLGEPRVARRSGAHHRLRTLARWRRRCSTRRPSSAGGAGARIHVHQHRRIGARARAYRPGWSSTSSIPAPCSRSILARC